MRLGIITVFQSKRDIWIVVLIWGGAILSVFGALAQLTGTAPFLFKAAMLVFLGSAAYFMLWVLYSIDYTLDDDNLLIRCGPFRYRVPLAAIDTVYPSHIPFSSPAASLDRLMIKWNAEKKRILISPSRKSDFLQELDGRCEQLTLVGDRLVRISPGD